MRPGARTVLAVIAIWLALYGCAWRQVHQTTQRWSEQSSETTDGANCLIRNNLESSDKPNGWCTPSKQDI